MRAVLIAVAAVLVAAGAAAPAMGAQLIASVNINEDSSPFNMRYLRTVSVQYPDGGQVAQMLRGAQAELSVVAEPGSPESRAVAEAITAGMLANGSQARVENVSVEYEASLRGGQNAASIDYKITIDGTLAGYVIRPLQGSSPAVVDMGWRSMSVGEQTFVGGSEINMPFSFVESAAPDLAAAMAGSEAEALMRTPLMNSDFILTQSLANWHVLFDPTGISVDAGAYGISSEIAGFVITGYTMGESSIREGIQIEKRAEATFELDRVYTVRSIESADNANIGVIGFAQLDTLDGLEIVGVSLTAPDTGNTSTGDFPVFIMYGMAGMAAVGAVAFFAYSSRQMKKEEGQGQTGIDPSRLVGRQTSASAGGYQTNRGEAQLADDSQYQRTRSVYDDPSAGPQPELPAGAAQEATCTCADSAEMGSECDCAMQGSCLCDSTCPCPASVCAEHSREF